MQSVLTLVIALSGSYEKILNYVVSMDFIFFGLTGASLFVFRRRDKRTRCRRISRAGASVDDGAVCGMCWLVVVNTIYKYPANTCWDWGFWRWGAGVRVLGETKTN